MAVKSIIDVDVNDDQFKSFMEMFKKYQDAIKKLPGAWGETEKAVGLARNKLEDMAGIIQKQTREQEKMRREVDKTNYAMGLLHKTTDKVYSRIKSTTADLFKWSGAVGILSTVVGAFSLAGFDQLARSASQARSQSMGIGIAPGQLQAANINYARFGGATPTLSRIAEMQSSDVEKNYLRLLGISDEDIKSKSAFDLLPQVLQGVGGGYQRLIEAGTTFNAGAHGYDQFGLSTHQLRQYAEASRTGELATLNSQLPGRAAAIGGSEDVYRRYQDFITRIDTSWTSLQATLISKLEPLSAPLATLLDAFKNLAASALSSDGFKNNLKRFADWINDFAVRIGTDEAKKNMEAFANRVGEVVAGLGRMVEWLAGWFPERPTTPEGTQGENRGTLIDRWHQHQRETQEYLLRRNAEREAAPPDNRPFLQRWLPGLERNGWRFGADPASYNGGGGSSSFLDRLSSAESGGNVNARNPLSSATGEFQFTRDTWLSVARKYGGSRVAGLSDDALLALRSHPTFAREMAEAHTRFDIAPGLAARGAPTSDLGLYAGWHFGAEGGASVMNAPGSMPMNQILSQRAITANPYLRSLTAGQWRERFSGSFGGGGGGGTQALSVQPGQGVQIMIFDATGGNNVTVSASLGAQGMAA
jgi:hypothetical protein